MQQQHKKRLVILGGGESGVGAAILGKDRGWDVFLSDSGEIAPHYSRVLSDEGIPFEHGHHTAELILNATEVIKSPGIPPTAPLVRELAAKGIPVISGARRTILHALHALRVPDRQQRQDHHYHAHTPYFVLIRH